MPNSLFSQLSMQTDARKASREGKPCAPMDLSPLSFSDWKEKKPILQEDPLLQNNPFVKMEFSVGAWGSNCPKGAPFPLNCLHF